MPKYKFYYLAKNMKLFIIRHLPTPWNKKGLMQGSIDICIDEITNEINESIKRQRTYLDNVDVDQILVSNLQRTHETAMAYGYSSFVVEPLLNELNFGKFEGRPRKEMLSALGDDWIADPRKLVLGESIRSLENRIKQFLHEYQSVDNLIVFGHGSWIRALLSYHKLNNLRDMNKIEVKNNQLVELNFNKQLVSME